MKDIPSDIVGKRISGVVFIERVDAGIRPYNQLFLCFEDGTSFEFWGGDDGIHPSGGYENKTVKSLLENLSPQFRVRQLFPESFGGKEP